MQPTAGGWWRALAALLIAVTTLAGAGRASAADPADPVPGLHAPICHSSARGASTDAPRDPAAPTPHDCCDACVLAAAAVLPAQPTVVGSVAVAVAVERPAQAVRAPSLPRQRGPRQSQGPPRG